MTYAATAASSELTFLDLPPEIRNNIYIYALLDVDNGDIPQRTGFSKVRFRRSTVIENKCYTPFSKHSLFQKHIGQHLIEHLWHRDLPIWCVNKQIRAEARSLHIAKFMSIDITGADEDFKYNKHRHVTARHVNRGLQLFEKWLDERVDDSLRKAMTTLELRDYVEMVAVDKVIPASVNDMPSSERSKGSRGTSTTSLPVFKVRISEDGDLLTVRVIRRLDPTQASALQAALCKIASDDVAQGRTRLDGDDILKCVRFLRQAKGVTWQSNIRQSSFRFLGEPEARRFTLFSLPNDWFRPGRSTKGSQDVDRNKDDADNAFHPYHDFHYTAASIRISDFKKHGN